MFESIAKLKREVLLIKLAGSEEAGTALRPVWDGLWGMKGVVIIYELPKLFRFRVLGTYLRRALARLLLRFVLEVEVRPTVLPGVSLSPRSTVFTVISMWSCP